MEPKVFYGERKTKSVAAIAEVHKAIEGAKNVINVVVYFCQTRVTPVIRKAIQKRF